jgi:hypothetical protein
MKRHALTVFLVAALSLPAFSQNPKKRPGAEPKPNAPKELTREELAKLGGFEPNPEDPPIHNLHFEVLMVTLPDALAVPLVASLSDPVRIEQGYQKLMTLIETKKARVSAWPRLQTRSGNRAVAENIHEVRYATEFERDLRKGAAAPAPAPPAEKVPPGPPMPAAQGVLPTAFETRNAGASLELEPMLGPDGKTMDIQFAAQHVRLVGWENVTVQESGATKILIPQPRFQTNKLVQNITIQSGQHMLIGTFRVGQENEMELFILKAAVVPLKVKAAPKK